MGKFTVDRMGVFQMKDADEIQQHYFGILTQPGGIGTGLLSKHFTGSLAKEDQSGGAR